MDALVARASMIWLSLHPSPASETSAFNKIRAFRRRCAGLLPFRVSAASCSRSSPLSRTTYFFTRISFAAMFTSVVRVATKANHQILSNWLKRSTRASARQGFLNGLNGRPVQIIGACPLDFHCDDVALPQRAARGDVDLAVDFGRIAFGAALGGICPGLIDDDRQALANFVLELAGADFLARFHKALVTDFLHLGRHMRQAEIIGARTPDWLIFEGARAVDFCVLKPVEKQLEIFFGL